LEEIKNITIVNVLDPGRAPVKKERPKRATNAGIMFLFCLVILSSYYVYDEYYSHRAKEYFVKFRNPS
jgi:hypothetical protein